MKNITQNALILTELFIFLKKQGVSQKQFCEQTGEEESKVSIHRNVSAVEHTEKYIDETEKENYQQKLIQLIAAKYQVTFERKEAFVKKSADIQVFKQAKREGEVFSAYVFSAKGETEWQGYFEFLSKEKRVIFHTYVSEENRFLRSETSINVHNSILSLFFAPNESLFMSHYCLYLGNKSLTYAQILLGTYSGVNENNAPVCGEVLLQREENAFFAAENITKKGIMPEIGFYLANKRITSENKIISQINELPTQSARLELMRVTGNYLAYRLSEEENTLYSTVVCIKETGKVLIKSSVSEIWYHANACIFLGTLLAINTYAKGNEPYYVQSLFNIGRKSRDELTLLYGVLAGTAKSPVVPRCAREIWQRTNLAFSEVSPQKILLSSAEYSFFKEQNPDIISYLTEFNQNVISV